MQRNLLACLIVAWAAAVSAAAERTRIELELTDGSRLFAEPVEGGQELRLKTRLGELNVPIADAERLEFAEGGRTVVVHWPGGDRLTATTQQVALQLQTVLGPLSVPLAAISRAKLETTRLTAIKPIGVHVSGHYAPHQTPAMAIDGEFGTAWSSGDWKGWIELDLGEAHEVGHVEFSLQFDPAGPATYEVHVGAEPIRDYRGSAMLIERTSGPRKDQERLVVKFPAGVIARHVQIYCPQSVSWFNIREFNVFSRKP